MAPRALAAAAGLAALPSAASAHAFTSGADLYEQFVEGAAVPLATPGLLLPLMALGLMLALWRADGMVAAWPAFLAGQVAGVGLAPFAGPGIAASVMALGLAAALIAAVLPGRGGRGIHLLAAATGALAMGAALEGHGFLELPPMIHAGLLFGTNLAASVAAGLAAVTLERWPREWLRIGWRVAASWIGAILALLAAFALRGMPGGI